MRALIIGGNSFFGKRLAELLVRAKHEVTLLNRGNHEDGLGARVERLKADRKELIQLHAVTKSRVWDVVFDQVCYEAVDAIIATRVFKGKTAHYVMTSSDAVYETGHEVREESFNPAEQPFDPDRVERSYAGGKRDAEKVFHSRAPFPVAMVRFSLVLGPEDPTSRLQFHVERVGKEEEIFFPSLQARTSMIDAESAARVLAFVGESGFKGPVNAASPSPISMRDFAEAIGRVTGKVPKFAGHGTDENRSPYALDQELTTSADRLKSLGFVCPEISEWLPGMVESVMSRLSGRPTKL